MVFSLRIEDLDVVAGELVSADAEVQRIIAEKEGGNRLSNESGDLLLATSKRLVTAFDTCNLAISNSPEKIVSFSMKFPEAFAVYLKNVQRISSLMNDA